MSGGLSCAERDDAGRACFALERARHGTWNVCACARACEGGAVADARWLLSMVGGVAMRAAVRFNGSLWL